MAKIKMIKTHTGALDGISIRKFSRGMVYSTPYQISDYLCELFLKMGVAKVARERNVYEPVEAPEKAVVEAPETKEIFNPDEIESVELPPEEIEEKEKTFQIFTLSDQLNITAKEIVEKAKKLGFDVKNHMSTLTESQVAEIKKSLNK